MNMLVTGSWYKTVKYWDLRQANPVHTQQMPEVRAEQRGGHSSLASHTAAG